MVLVTTENALFAPYGASKRPVRLAMGISECLTLLEFMSDARRARKSTRGADNGGKRREGSSSYRQNVMTKIGRLLWNHV